MARRTIQRGMLSIEFELNNAGFRQLRNSPAMQAVLKEKADAVLARAGGSEYYSADVQPGRTRAHAIVATSGKAGMAHEQKTGGLLRGLG